MAVGIQARLTAGIALVASLLVLAVGWAWTAHEEEELLSALGQREARMASLVERSFAGPIWNLDQAAIDNLLDAVMADPEVHAVELKGLGLRGGLAKRERDGAASGSLRREFPINYQVGADSPGLKVASAALVYTRELVDEQIRRTRLFVVGLLAAVVVGIVVASSLLVDWLVRRPLARLGALAERVAKGDLGAQAAIERTDEVGALSARFNAMSLKLRSAADQVQLSADELAQHRDHLEELVASRTAELSEAKTRAEAANFAKGRFLATMSHEFRTPLNAILGFTQLMQMDASVPTALKPKLQLMRDSGLHLLELINDVLDMASIEAGKVTLKPTPCDLRALLDMAGDNVRLRAEQKGLRYELALAPGLPSQVVVDGQRLRQVLINLLSNAVKFTDQGAVSLRATALSQQQGHARLSFEVADTGIGMTATQQSRLFQAFEQVSDASRTLGGTGLGLSISQQLVQLMGGHIRAQSVPGEGSRFTFELHLPVVGMPA